MRSHAQATNKRIRVLIAEDNHLHAEILQQILRAHKDLLIVGVAGHGQEAQRLNEELRPDLITMDVHMPVLDGYEATLAIMATRPVPILVIAELASRHDISAQKMLGAGALDIFPKPQGLELWAAASEALAQRIRVLSRTRVAARPRPAISPRTATGPAAPAAPCADTSGSPRLVAMVASMGGPAALLRILRQLPAGYALPIVVVQHTAVGFGAGLARWLGQSCAVPLTLVNEETALVAPGIYLAPDDRHLILAEGERLLPDSAAAVGSLRPRGDLLLSSVARLCGARAVGIILTGMGDDGARGLLEMRRAGALTIAQDESSAAMFAMPKVAAATGAAALVLTLDEIVAHLLSYHTLAS
jgi:two-component system chemotaxis response regulator CheB